MCVYTHYIYIYIHTHSIYIHICILFCTTLNVNKQAITTTQIVFWFNIKNPKGVHLKQLKNLTAQQQQQSRLTSVNTFRQSVSDAELQPETNEAQNIKNVIKVKWQTCFQVSMSSVPGGRISLRMQYSQANSTGVNRQSIKNRGWADFIFLSAVISKPVMQHSFTFFLPEDNTRWQLT